MPKINKVFLDCQAVMSDGAALCDAGAYNISIISKEFAKPLFLIAPRYKFTPLYAFS
jgi:translation initiation factor 2B subunit (eIF-2B alpha/beta/delta family)